MFKRKYKFILISLASLLVACGSSGGGGSSNTPVPINPGNNITVSPTTTLPNNNTIQPNPETSESDLNAPGNVSENNNTPSETMLPKEDNVSENKETNVTVTINTSVETNKEDINLMPNNNTSTHTNSTIISGENNLDKNGNKYKELILEARSRASELIPTDSSILNGSSYKVGILDGDFISKKEEFEQKYPGIEILERNENAENYQNDHTVFILEALRENNQVGIIAESIGVEIKDNNGNSTDTVHPTLEDYHEVLSRFPQNQKVKIFSQSWGVPEPITNFKYDNMGQVVVHANLAPSGGTISDGENILNFYSEQTKNNSIFVWANGNDNNVKEAYFQAGLPALFSSTLGPNAKNLERGWISAVGILSDNEERNAQREITKEATLRNLHREPNNLTYPGENAKWWSISADAVVVNVTRTPQENSIRITTKVSTGSSYAAPRVARAATLVAEKFDWMTNDQVRQTLFTTTDKTEIPVTETDIRRKLFEPDSKYGWGMLNQDRALKGPGAFINVHSTGSYKNFEADIPENKTSYFENDIIGDGGLIKQGKGTLHLTGNNSYSGGSKIENGTLEIHKVHSSSIDIENNGTLVLHSKALIGYDTYNNEIINDSNITPDKIKAENVTNNGTVRIEGNTAIIGGNYIANAGSSTQADFTSKVRVLGEVQFNNTNINLTSDAYTRNGEKSTLIEASSINGNIENISINGMRTATTTFTDNTLVAEVNRIPAITYLKNASESSKNIAVNIDNIFSDLDSKIEKGSINLDEIRMLTTLQNSEISELTSATEMMSGEIYASAQALTFSQAQNINKSLSNRLSNLDNLKHANEKNEMWISAIGSDGKIKSDGYASADTRVIGSQIGMDRRFGNNTVGLAFAYSHAKADFNKYAGKSESDMQTLSLYGKHTFPYDFYTAGRLGASYISTEVERDLLDANGNNVRGKIGHHDKMFSTYIEIGKKFGWFNPFIGYSYDFLKRGSFNENNASWGIKTPSKNYQSSSFLAGVRAEYIADKYKLDAHITQSTNVSGRDLSFEGSYSGYSLNQKFHGIKQAKNTTWIGVGAFREINPTFGVYGNIDFRFEDGRRADSVVSTGFQFKF